MFYEINVYENDLRQTLFVTDLSYVTIAYTILKHVPHAGTDDEVLGIAQALCSGITPTVNGIAYTINLA